MPRVDEKGPPRLRRATLGPNGTVEGSEALFPANAEPTVLWFDVSPDGKLLAFVDGSGIHGQPNVFVTTLPDVRERRQVTSHGFRPRLSSDGKLL